MLEQLFEAAKDGDVVRVQAIVDQDEKWLNARKENGESALMVALYHGRREVVHLLLQRGMPLNVHEATALGDLELLMEFVQEEPSFVMLESADGWTPLHLAAYFGAFPCVRYLVEQGADVNAVSNNKMKTTPLHHAVASRKIEIVRYLIEQQADLHAKQAKGWTPLHQAVDMYDIEIVQLLLERGADPEQRTADGLKPIDLAIAKGYEDLQSLLESKS